MAEQSQAKSADTMNKERRAAKARQQLAKKARAVHKQENQVFNLQSAHQSNINRQHDVARKAEELERESEKQFNEIATRGSLKIEKNDFPKRDAYISYCFKIIERIRQSDKQISYTRDWKETGIFVAGLHR